MPSAPLSVICPTHGKKVPWAVICEHIGTPGVGFNEQLDAWDNVRVAICDSCWKRLEYLAAHPLEDPDLQEFKKIYRPCCIHCFIAMGRESLAPISFLQRVKNRLLQ